MDITTCKVCYEKKAKYFCVDCKQASGVCYDCYINTEEVNNGAWACFPINCIICRKSMWYSYIQYMLNYDIEEKENSLFKNRDKCYELDKIQMDNSEL
jgi:hypothetical protein